MILVTKQMVEENAIKKQRERKNIMKLSWKELSVPSNRMILLCFRLCAEAALARIIPYWSDTLFTECASVRVLHYVSDIVWNSPSSFSVHFLSQREIWSFPSSGEVDQSSLLGRSGISKYSKAFSFVFILGWMAVSLSAWDCNVFFNYDGQSAEEEGMERSVTKRVRYGSSTTIRELQDPWMKSVYYSD